MKLFSWNHTWLTYGCWKNHISVTFVQGHQATEATEFNLSHDEVRFAHPIATKLGRYISLVMLSMIQFWINSVQHYSNDFFSCNCKSVFPILAFYLPYHRNGWSNGWETTRKLVNWTLCCVGYFWPWPLTLNFKSQIPTREWEARLSWNWSR